MTSYLALTWQQQHQRKIPSQLFRPEPPKMVRIMRKMLTMSRKMDSALLMYSSGLT